MWNQLLFGCTEEIPLCLAGFCYPCGPAGLQGYAIYRNSSSWVLALAMETFACWCPCIGIGLNRNYIRSKLNINGNIMLDM